MPNIRSYNYHNIAISGLPGSGSTTLLRLLKESLDLDGWRGYSGGEFMRAYAAEKGLFDGEKKLHHKATHYEDDFDRQIDMGVREKLKTQKKWIIEGSFGSWTDPSFKKADRIIILKPNRYLRALRIAKRDIKAKFKITNRKAESLKSFFKFLKWNHLYDKDNLLKLEEKLEKYNDKILYFKKADQIISYFKKI